MQKLHREHFDTNTPTNHLWKPTFAKKMVSINGNGFPLHGNFGQNLKSCFQPKNFENV